MSYRFELQEKIAPGFARIATEQIDRVLRDLDTKGDRATAVHESRKSLKRLRALLRLARPAIGEPAFKTHNAGFRDIGALFSADRDRAVLREVAAGLAAQMGDRFSRAFAAIDASLADPAPGKAASPASLRKDAVTRLTSARRHIVRLKLTPDDFAALQQGLELSYRRGRRELRNVYSHPSDEGFHDLRKAVQQHWRHMQMLQRAWPDVFQARLAVARNLSQILGDDHDLAVLVEYLTTLPTSQLSVADRQAITRHCRERQAVLRQQARPVCEQLYVERARPFAKRIAAIWRSGEDIDAAQQAAAAAAKPPSAKRKAPGKSSGKSSANAPRKSRAARSG